MTIVGVLLDGSGFGQVGELGARIAPAGELAVELGEDDDGDAELAGEVFEAAGDEGDLQTALLDADTGGDELEVVDDQEGEVGVVGFEPPGAGFEVAEDEAGGVVEVERGGGEAAGGGVEVAPLAGGDVALAEVAGGDAGFGGAELEAELAGAHFEGEDADRALQLDGDVAGEVEGEGGLAHAGAAGDDV